LVIFSSTYTSLVENSLEASTQQFLFFSLDVFLHICQFDDSLKEPRWNISRFNPATKYRNLADVFAPFERDCG